MGKHRGCIHHPLRGDPPMLPDVTLPASLAALLGALRPCFTAPSYRTFCGLAAGRAGPRRRRPPGGVLLGARGGPGGPARPAPPLFPPGPPVGAPAGPAAPPRG